MRSVISLAPPPISHLSAFIVIVGVSGAGRTISLGRLSDLGFYTVDNLPISLFSAFVEFTKQLESPYNRVAITVNTEDAEKVSDFLNLIRPVNTVSSDKLAHPAAPLVAEPKSGNFILVFLDSDTEVLVKRYSETRRPHPKFDPILDSSLQETIHRERVGLAPLKHRANFTLDTSSFTVHDLRREITAFAEALDIEVRPLLRVTLITFGFKFGAPRDCDLLIDVRFLPNPFFIPDLRDKTGIEPLVSDYVLQSQGAAEFIDRYASLLNFLLPQYSHEGKAYLNIGIGCTGGKHRSVAIAEALKTQLQAVGTVLTVRHRDIAIA